MRALILEVRDDRGRGDVFLPVLALEMRAPESDTRQWLLNQAMLGHAVTPILLVRLAGGGSLLNPQCWEDRTMRIAHEYITTNFDRLHDGDVIDVQFILGETLHVKESKRLDHANSGA